MVQYVKLICGYGGTGRRAGLRILWATVQVRFLLSAPKKSYQNDTPFYIHCKSNGIDAPKLAIPSLRSLHHATCLRVYHHRRCISSAVGCIRFCNDDIQYFALMICNFIKLMIYNG